MTNRVFYTPAAHDLKPALSAEKGMSHAGYGVVTQLNKGQADVHTLFQQLAQSLTVLSGACELVLEEKGIAASAQALRVWLQPHARQAEAAMHRLRDLRLTRSPSITDLSQSLTVLVLAADMLAQGQLSGDDALSFYELLRRNAAAAIKNLAELRAQYGLEAHAPSR